MAPKCKVIFIHIPKTAGTSLLDAISCHFEPSRRLIVPGALPLSYLTDAQLAQLDYIHGHIGVGLFDRLEPSWRRITALRHPVERLVSLYYYHRAVDEPQQLAWLAKRLTLEEFFDSDNAIIRNNVDNGQTWQLFHDIGTPFRTQYRDWRGRDILAQAIRNLATFDVLCIQEHFTESLKLLESRLGLSIGLEPRANVNAARPPLADVPPRLIDKIRARNPLDLELYEAGLELFRSMTAATAP